MRRYEELDSLRGLAALSVVMCHFLLVFPALDYLNIKGSEFHLLKYTPLHLFWGGHEAVILFFMLSGFVLSLPFFNSKQLNYSSFIIKRVCRIYLPYIVAVLFSLVGCYFLYKGVLTGLSKWINVRWDDPISLKIIIEYVTLIFLPSYSGNEYNPALWSLVHEMRISIIFPLIILMINRLNWKAVIGIGMMLSMIGFIERLVGINILIDDFFFSLQYILMFMTGSLMAKHKDVLSKLYSKMSLRIRIAVAVVGILCYTYNWWFFYDISIIHLEILNDWSITIGAAVFIVFALFSKTTSSIMLFKPVHFLGKISYSLYLLHGAILLSLLHVFNNILPTQSILLIAFCTAIVVSTIFYFLIEKPSMKLGRKLTSTYKSKQKTVKISA